MQLLQQCCMCSESEGQLAPKKKRNILHQLFLLLSPSLLLFPSLYHALAPLVRLAAATSSAPHLSFIAYIKGPRCGAAQLTRTRTHTHTLSHMCETAPGGVCECECESAEAVSIWLMDNVASQGRGGKATERGTDSQRAAERKSDGLSNINNAAKPDRYKPYLTMLHKLNAHTHAYTCIVYVPVRLMNDHKIRSSKLCRFII